MRMQLKIISLVLLALSLSQCGKKTKSQDVNITVTPNSPIVFTNDTTVLKGGVSIPVKGPYFQFSVNIENTTDSSLVILALHVEVTGVDANNVSKTVEADFLPSDDDFSNTTTTCSYADYGLFEKNGVTGNSGALTRVTGGVCPSGTKLFTAGGLPKPSSTSTIRYTVKIKPIGYFGTRAKQEDRFDSYTTIYTN